MPICSCSACRREFTQPLERLVDLIRRGKTRCQLCGAGLVFPDEALAAASRDAGPRVPDALREYTCRACQRTWTTSPEDLEGRRRSGCRMCGAPLNGKTLEALDSLVRERRSRSVTRARLQCLLCRRITWFDGPSPEDICRCQFCAAPHRLPAAAGEPARPPPLGEPPANAKDVSRILGAIGWDSDAMRFFREVLLARSARAELGAPEALRLATQLAALDRWDPEPGEVRWPLPVAEAAEAVPPVLFPGKAFRSERASEGRDVVFVVGESAPGGSKEAMVINAIGLASLVFGGVGLFVAERDRATADQHRVRVAIRPADRGVELALFTQVNDEDPSPANRHAAKAFRDMVAAQKGPLLAYYGTLAVFGDWASGSAAAATAPAIAERLDRLGLKSRADPWASWLCLAQASAPGTP